MSQDVVNDWNQREFITKVELGVRKCVDFLNHFQQSARYRLSVVNQRLTSLERKLDYIENEIEHGDPHTRGAKPKPFEGSIFDPKARYEDTKLKLDRRKKQRGFTGNVIAPKKSNRGKMITVGTGFKGARKMDTVQKLPQGKVVSGTPNNTNNTNKTPQNNQQQLQQQKRQQEMQRQKQIQQQKQQEMQRQKQLQEQQRQKQLQEQQRQKQLQEQQRQKQLQEQQRQKQLQEQQRQKQLQEQQRQKQLQEQQRQKQLQEQQRKQQELQRQKQQQMQQQRMQQQRMQQQRMQQQKQQQPGQNQPRPPGPPGPPGPPPMQPGMQPGQRPPQPGQNQQKQFPHGDPNRIDLRLIQQGNGPRPQGNSKVKVQYVGYLPNGKKFISHSEVLFLGQRKTIRGLEQAVQMMQVGSRARVWIPSKLAYGQRGAPGLIPPNSNLTFDIAVLQIVG